MMVITLYSKENEVLAQREFETSEDAGEYLTTIGYDSREYKKDENYYIELCNDVFKKETMMMGSIVWVDNRDVNQITYEIKNKSILKEFIQPRAWGEDLNLVEVFPHDWLDLKNAFKEFIEEVELDEKYIDSYRIGVPADEESMKEYYKFETCCGSTDKKREVNGITYMFGCNYGH